MNRLTTTKTPLDAGQQARRHAEALAEAALEAAQARAAAIIAAAAARASASCGAIERHAAVVPSDRAAPGVPYASPACAGVVTDQAVALRAYFKAERRGFVPGHETEDWFEAERELTAATVDPGADADPRPARDADAAGIEDRHRVAPMPQV